MTSCRIASAHRYDFDESLWVNLVGKHQDVGGFNFHCPSGFLVATDFSTYWMLAGSIVSAAIWKTMPRLSSALLAGGTMFWLGMQTLAYERNLLSLFYSERPDEHVYGAYYFEAYIWQAAFEFTIFCVLPFLVVRLIARRNQKRVAAVHASPEPAKR